MSNKAVFFDRDGVLNVDTDYISLISSVELYDGAADIIAYCKNLGYWTFIVTNQPIVARGIISEEELIKFNFDYKTLLLKQNCRAEIDEIFYCTHHPEADVEKYRILCDCRKPKPGLLIKAIEKYSIDPSKSFMVGDRISDIIAGFLAGCKTIQYKSGKHLEPMIKTDLNIPENIQPDYIIDRISDLRKIIV
ncbi:MAG: HAD family hydrolase [Candidatus Gastranaerophilales bacterium]|nr:HAD family hydrolase [Candidatus Gastranaerophilales bacterium]